MANIDHQVSSSSKVFSFTWTEIEGELQEYLNVYKSAGSFNMSYGSSTCGIQSVFISKKDGYSIRKLELLAGGTVFKSYDIAYRSGAGDVYPIRIWLSTPVGTTASAYYSGMDLAYATPTVDTTKTYSSETSSQISLKIYYVNKNGTGTLLNETHLMYFLEVVNPKTVISSVDGLKPLYRYGDAFPGDDAFVTYNEYFYNKDGTVSSNKVYNADKTTIDFAYSPSPNTRVPGTYAVNFKYSNSSNYPETVTVKYSYGLYPSTANLGSPQSPLKIAPGKSLNTSSLITSCVVMDNDDNVHIITSNFSVSPATLAYSDAVAAAGGAVQLTVTAMYDGDTLTKTVDAYLSYALPVALSSSITLDSSKTYYYSDLAYFAEPSFLTDANETLLVVYETGDTVDISSRKNDLESRAVAGGEGTALEIGDSFTKQNTLYAGLNVSDGGGNNHFCEFTYTLTTEEDTISSITLDEPLVITYGTLLSAYADDISFSIMFNHIPLILTNEDFSWYFNNTSYIKSNTDDTSITINGQVYQLSGTINYLVPTINQVYFGGSYSTIYVNGADGVDFRNLKIYVSYVGIDYVSVYNYQDVSISPFDNSNVSIDLNPDVSPFTYDGETVVNITGFDDDSTLSGYFKITATNEFDNSATQNANITFLVCELLDITGIRVIGSPYDDYKVRDTFLNEHDDTQITFYYTSNNVPRSKTIKLADGFSSIATVPSRGHQFTNVDYTKVVKVYSVLNTNVYAEYTTKVSPRKQIGTSETINLVAVWVPSLENAPESEYGLLALVGDSAEIVDKINGVITLKPGVTPKYYGYITDIFDEDVNARVVLFDDYVTPIDGAGNIVVTYPSYYDGVAEAINKCHFGILFGTNNATNRLFVSGNPEIKNADWHSAEINTTHLSGEGIAANGNFSYFSDESIMYYGETDNAVIGYDIVSNDKLLVLKTKSDKEKTVYFRTPTTVKALDAGGSEMTDIEGNALYQEEFALVKGNGSNAGISPKSIANFNGDSLFIDNNNNLVGLDLTGIVGDSQRYANSRSKLIDYKLKDLDLSNSILWTNNKYLVFTVEDFGMFVTHYETLSEGQYEWWLLDTKNPTVFIEKDNVVYFGNKEGHLYKINKNYVDSDKLFIKAGDAVIDNQIITLNSNIIDKMSDEESYKFKAYVDESDYRKNLYYRVARINDETFNEMATKEANVFVPETGQYVTKTVIVENPEMMQFPIEGKSIYYLNSLGTNGYIDCEEGSEFAEFGAAYRLVKVETEQVDNDCYLIEKYINGVWTEIDLSELNAAALCKRAGEEELEVSDIDREENTIRLKKDGSYVPIVVYGFQQGASATLTGEISKYEDVESYYITAPFSFGNLNSLKTIWQFTLTNDTDIPSSLEVAYASNKIPTKKYKMMANISAGALGLDFNDLMFGKTDFDKTVVPRTYTTNRVLAYQKFICFAFKNSPGNNAVLSAMTVTYTIPYPAYGGD